MNIFRKIVVLILASMVAASATVVLYSQNQKPEQQERAAIERLHQQDVEATLSDKADDLAKLWDSEAVRLQAGGAAEIGLAAIYANDKRWEVDPKRGHTLSYKADVKDLQISGDWAFEWGYFTCSYRDSLNGPIKSFRAKLLRVLERQGDGSWKFARVMWNLAE